MIATREKLLLERRPGANDQHFFKSMDALLAAPGEIVTADRYSGVSRLTLGNRYYLKRFHGRSNWWRFLLGIDRYSREVANLRLFNQIGLSTPRMVAHGHSTSFGILRRAVLVTEEVPNALDLQSVLRSGQLYRHGVAEARVVLGQLTDAIRLLHQQRFYAADLKPRNVLVAERGGRAQLYFFDCPRGRYSLGWRFRRQRIKDLAHIYRDLRPAVRKVDLMWMYTRYLGKRVLDDQDKQLARRSMEYYDTRRMTSARRRRQQRRNSSGSWASST